jgi:hypothetical protein
MKILTSEIAEDAEAKIDKGLHFNCYQGDSEPGM